MKRARHDGDEQDAFSRWGKRYLIWRAGQRKRIKRRANRRDRRNAKRGVWADYTDSDLIIAFAKSQGVELTPWQLAMLRHVYRDTDSLGDLQTGGVKHD